MKLLFLSMSLMSAATNSSTQPEFQGNQLQGRQAVQELATIPALTPEMWQQLQQLHSPPMDSHQAVIRIAAQRGAERRQRLAALKAYGYSKSRPVVRHTPFTSFYAPQWIERCRHW